MGLFSTLLSTDSVNVERKSDKLPTVIQLYHNEQPLEFLKGASTNNKNQKSSSSSFSPPLEYTAIQCNLDEEGEAKDVGLRSSLKKPTIVVPDLGVWSCRILKGSTSNNNIFIESSVLGGSDNNKNNSTYILTIDLTVPENVETSITKQQEALVRHLIQKSGKSTATTIISSSTQSTTSLRELRTVQFGLAPEDTTSKTTENTSTTTDELDDKVKITLNIVCKMDKNSDNDNIEEGEPIAENAPVDDYKTQQIRSLLFYHVRKYAAALNATLIFISGGKSSVSSGNDNDKNKERQPTLLFSQVPFVWKALAEDIPIWKYKTIDALIEGKEINTAEENTDITTSNSKDNEGKEEEEETNQEEDGKVEEQNKQEDNTTTSGYSLIYGGTNHDIELIDTVLLRAATYPGNWDASKESIWTILQPTDSNDTNNDDDDKKSSLSSGDQGWLKELYDSISTSTNTASGQQQPATVTPVKQNASAQQEQNTPNDTVSSFFEDLLK